MIASNSASSSANDVSIRHWISGWRERISRQTSTPLPSGRRTSSTATSGRVAGMRRSASSAVPASPTTSMSPPRPRGARARRAARSRGRRAGTPGWSRRHRLPSPVPQDPAAVDQLGGDGHDPVVALRGAQRARVSARTAASSAGSVTSRATPVTTTLQPVWSTGSMSSTSNATTVGRGRAELGPPPGANEDAVAVQPEVDRQHPRKRPAGDLDAADHGPTQEAQALRRDPGPRAHCGRVSSLHRDR